jgi:uncharacterized protein (DUF362 family)
MDSHLSRRRFLRNLVILGAGYGLIPTLGCGAPPSPAPTGIPGTSAPTAAPFPTPAPAATATPAAAATAAPTAAATATPAPQAAQLAVARGGNPEAITRAAIEALGGMSRFVKPGDRVVVKPNILTAAEPQYAVTTNPQVMAALVKMCLEAGASAVQVFDSPTTSVATAYERSGIERAVTEAGARMERMSQLKFKKTDIPAGRSIKSWSIYEDVLTADVVINAAIAKTHNLAGLTMGMKNLMGVITERGSFHSNIHQRLADLNSAVRPTLTVIDAVRVLVRNGPTGGRLSDVEEMDTLIASPDVVAADSYGATLFGKKGSDLAYLRIAAEMGLGTMDLEKLTIKEVRV